MGCAASSRVQPHPAEVAKDRKATAESERQLAKARAAQEAPAAFPSLGPAATAMGCASSQPVAPKPKTHALRGVHAGVQLGWLKRFVKQVPPGMSTLDVVLKIIKPATKERLCRYVSLAEEEAPGAVGTAKIFASHTWRAPFRDLVAALAHVADDKDYVWIDVRRRPERPIAAPPSNAPLSRADLRRAAVGARGRPHEEAGGREARGPRLCCGGEGDRGLRAGGHARGGGGAAEQ